MVAPPVGAWIEISLSFPTLPGLPLLPPWERGLKSGLSRRSGGCDNVAPPVGAWIEIEISGKKTCTMAPRRSPRGSVD